MDKKVCMIAYSNFSGDPRIRRESEALASHGHKVTFLSLCENTTPEVYTMKGVTVRELRVRKYRGQSALLYILSYMQFLTFAFFACSSLFLRNQIDIVHVHNMPNFLVFAALLPRIVGKKLVLDIHDSVPETYKGKFGKLPKAFLKFLYMEEWTSCAFAHKVICVNDVQRETLLQRGIRREKITVVLNVPDPKIFGFSPKRIDAASEKRNVFNLVYHGTIERMLGIDLAIQGVARLIDRIPGLHFYVLGGGGYLEEFESLAKRLGVEDRVHFSKKHFPVESLPGLLKDMDLGIIPNRKNGATDLMLPVKLLEYVGMGIPVVTARLKAIEHYFSDDMVKYFEAENVESMATAILDLYNDKNKRKRQVENARVFLERFGWEKHQNKLLNLYGDLSNHPPKVKRDKAKARSFSHA